MELINVSFRIIIFILVLIDSFKTEKYSINYFLLPIIITILCITCTILSVIISDNFGIVIYTYLTVEYLFDYFKRKKIWKYLNQ